MDGQTDSRGLVPSQASSSIDTTATVPHGLNVKALPTEYRRLAQNEGVNQAMIRLVANFGEPWGRDQSMAQVMSAEWNQPQRVSTARQ